MWSLFFTLDVGISMCIITIYGLLCVDDILNVVVRRCYGAAVHGDGLRAAGYAAVNTAGSETKGGAYDPEYCL